MRIHFQGKVYYMAREDVSYLLVIWIYANTNILKFIDRSLVYHVSSQVMTT